MSRTPPERTGRASRVAAIRGRLILVLLILPILGPFTVSAAADVADGALRIEAAGPAVVKARTAALLVSEMSGGSIRTEVLALPWPEPLGAGSGGDRRPVVVRLEIDGGSLLEPAAPQHLEVFLYALGDDAEVLEAVTLRFLFDPERHGGMALAGGLAVAAVLELPPGEHRLRHLVWADSRRFGLGTTALKVPAADPPSVVWIAERPDRWLEVAAPADASAAGLRFAGDDAPAPAGLPVLSPSETPAEAWWLVPGGRPASESGEGGRVRWRRILPGRPVEEGAWAPAASPPGEPTPASVPFEVLERRRTAGGSVLLRVAFPVPVLEAGRYELSLLPAAGAASGSLPVIVAPAEAGEVWPRVLPEAGIPEPQDEPLPPPPAPSAGAKTLAAEGAESEGWRSRQSDAYRTVVGRLAAGDAEGAARELALRERDATTTAEGEDPAPLLAPLTEVQREQAAQLLGPQAEGATALALLHAEVARRHFETGRWVLAGRAVEQAIWLAEGYAEVAASRQARRDAAALLTSLAVDLRAAGQSQKALALFQRSLDLEETNAALLGLATLEERSGTAAQAVAALERLVERSPGHREGRLRLAVNLARLGRTDRARELLRRLLVGADDSWVTAVAFQELARIELGEGDCAGAVRVLRQARELLPKQPQIAVQMAWALECAGEIAGSRATTAALIERARRGEPTADNPRMRYTRWNDQALAAERQRLAELDRLGREALARVVEPRGEGR